MATIVKRGKKYSVVYNYTDENGVQRQKWEPPVATKKEARQRLAEVEYEIQKGTFIVPTCRKVSDFLAEFVEVYGTKKWGLSMYAANTGLIRNYINPILGDVLVQDVDTRAVDRFITRLQRTKAQKRVCHPLHHYEDQQAHEHRLQAGSPLGHDWQESL